MISLQENELLISLTGESIGTEGREANSKTADNDNSDNSSINNNNNNNSNSKRTNYVNADEKNDNSAANTRRTFLKSREKDVKVLIINLFK